MTSERILECPFCTSSDLGFNEDRSCVVCDNCMSEGPYSEVDYGPGDSTDDCKADAIRLWNKRTGTVYNGKPAHEWYSLYCKELLDRRRVQLDIMSFMNTAEQNIIEPDRSDEVGINNHLRVMWGLRDRINEYFSKEIPK